MRSVATGMRTMRATAPARKRGMDSLLAAGDDEGSKGTVEKDGEELGIKSICVSVSEAIMGAETQWSRKPRLDALYAKRSTVFAGFAGPQPRYGTKKR